MQEASTTHTSRSNLTHAMTGITSRVSMTNTSDHSKLRLAAIADAVVKRVDYRTLATMTFFKAAGA